MEKINPVVKGVTVLLSCVILAITSSWQMNIFVFGLGFLILVFASRCKLLNLLKVFLPVLVIAASSFVAGLLNGENQVESSSIYQAGDLDSALLLSTRILAYVALGMVFAMTTDQKTFIMSLIHQAHLKPKFAYGVLAAVNLLPTLNREWDQVNLAYRVRQKKRGILPFGPLFNSLVNGIRWSENVAMAMESKGFDGDGKRTYAMVTKVVARDYVFAIVMICLMLGGMIVSFRFL